MDNDYSSHYKEPYNQSQVWKQPQVQNQSYVTGLKLNNSLHPGTLVPFIPLNGKLVKFYYCGPTVYSYTHLGHARTYIGLDIIKRIMRDYFKYDMFTIMNITDIDDKIINNSIEQGVDFLEFTKKWEKDFFDQMELLNVELPDGITRVSEYVDEIILFIKKIIENGYAYESNGSVYFDVQKYKSDGYTYCKLTPFNQNNKKLLEEGEGNLDAQSAKEKKNETDFALWKACKPGEPNWQSPWGAGRPGWHIECSVMAYELLGSPIDLHAGGIDLRFPHHDNSIAQTESFLQCDQWINYFIHTGHLNIKDQKMSKSLKNFMTIQEILVRYTSRQIRLNFALHLYDTVMNYSEESMQESIHKDQAYSQFFMTIRAVIRDSSLVSIQKWTQAEIELNNCLIDVKQKIHEHFCNNFNLPAAIKEIDNLIYATNLYLMNSQKQKAILINVFRQIQQFMELLGLQYQQQGGSQDQIIPLMNILSKFRDQIRKSSKDKDFKAILEVCDLVRDYDLINIGIKLEDKALGEPSVWKQSNPAELIKEREILEQQKKKIQEEKLQKEQAAQAKEKLKLDMMKLPPNQLFVNQTDLYSLFDNNGIPSHDKDGKELSKKQQKYVKQKWDEQNKLYQDYLNKQQ